MIRGRMDQWQLELDLQPGALPWSGHGGDCRSGPAAGTAAALKVAFPHDEALVERHALALWDGHGAVRLLASDAGTCAMLLERLDAGRSLQTEPMDTAVEVWGGLMRELSLVPDAPARSGRNSSTWRRARNSGATTFPRTGNSWAGRFPRWLLEAALEVCQTRGAVGRRSGTDVLVNTDFHFLNILARPPATAREPPGPGADGFAAIDPQPMVGEAEFAVAPLLWNRIRDLPAPIPPQGCWNGARTSASRPAWIRRPPASGALPGRWTTPCTTPRRPAMAGTWPGPCGWPAPLPAGP